MGSIFTGTSVENMGVFQGLFHCNCTQGKEKVRQLFNLGGSSINSRSFLFHVGALIPLSMSVVTFILIFSIIMAFLMKYSLSSIQILLPSSLIALSRYFVKDYWFHVVTMRKRMDRKMLKKNGWRLPDILNLSTWGWLRWSSYISRIFFSFLYYRLSRHILSKSYSGTWSSNST